MPDRIVRANILTSEKVNGLGWPEEVFYRRLINVVDDFGRYDARPGVLRAALYPLCLDKVREADVSRWMAECQKAGLIVLYEVDSKPYLELHNLGDRRRAKHSKYPPPPSSAGACRQMTADDGNGTALSPDSDSESDADADADSRRAGDGGGTKSAEDVLIENEGGELFAGIVEHLRTPVFKRAFARWVLMRRENGQRGIISFRDQLGKLASLKHDDAVARLRVATERGYKGVVYEEKPQKGHHQKHSAATSRQDN